MIVLRALGTAEIDTGVATLTPSQEILFAAALYLILERGKRVSRTRLASLLWPRVPEKPRAHRLRQTILQLKKVGIMPRVDRDNLQLSQHDVRCDLDDLSASDTATVLTHDSLEFLPGYNPRLSESLRDWVDLRREEAHAAATRLLVHEVDRSRLQADWLNVEATAAKCLSLDQYNETAVLAQAEAAAMRGGKRKAVSILDRYLAEVGPSQANISLPATLLRRRIVERIPDRQALLNADPAFVGRQGEMEALARSLERARIGHGSATLIVGEPGIGKSRLTAELGRFADLQGAQVQRASCRRADIDRPLSLFVDIVPQLREMPGALGCAPETFAALRRLTEFDQRQGDQSHAADSELHFQSVRAALFDLLDSVSEERCLVVLVEDVQWLDRVSATILASMVESCSTRNVFFLLNSRPGTDFLRQYRDAGILEIITLAPLEAAASVSLLQSVALRPGDELESEFVSWCLSVAEGNPFFLQELAHQWIETGRRHEAPPSVAKVLQERLSRLSEGGLRTLQSCAILGDHATIDRVERVLEFPSHQLLSAVEELSKSAMLRVSRDGQDSPIGQLQPRHDFLSSAAISHLSPVSRAFLHKRSAEVLEKEFAQETMPTALLWACASHRHHSGDRERAMSLSISCAEHLLEVGLAHDACTAFQRSLEFCITDDQRLSVLPRLAFASQLDGKWEKSLQVLRRCIELRTKGTQTKNTHNDFELLSLEARYNSRLDFATLLSEALCCVESPEATPAHRVRASVLALKVATDFGPLETLDSIYGQISPFLNESEVNEATRLEVQMVYRTMRGEKIVSRGELWEFAEVVRQSEGEVAYSRALVTAASACRMSARYVEGLEFLSTAYDHAVSKKLHSRLIQILFPTVRMHLTAGHFDEAKQVLVEAQKYPITSDNTWEQTEIYYMETRIAIEQGDWATAARAFSAIEAVQPTYSVTRAGNYSALELRIRLRQKAPRNVIESLTTKLEGTHMKMRRIGSQDFESYALYLGLCALGARKKATRLLREYVERHRRSRWPLARQVSSVLSIEKPDLVSASPGMAAQNPGDCHPSADR